MSDTVQAGIVRFTGTLSACGATVNVDLSDRLDLIEDAEALAKEITEVMFSQSAPEGWYVVGRTLINLKHFAVYVVQAVPA